MKNKYTVKIYFDMWNQTNVWERDFGSLRAALGFFSDRAGPFNELNFHIHSRDLSGASHNFDTLHVRRQNIERIEVNRREGPIRETTQTKCVAKQFLNRGTD